jgi:hypothetical protein
MPVPTEREGPIRVERDAGEAAPRYEEPSMSEAYEAYERRVRERAHQIWLDEGRPDGRAEEHWARAREQISEEEGVKDTLKPIEGPDAEPLVAVESLGDLPGRLSDQGERQDYPVEPKPKRKAPVRKKAG